MSCHIHYPIDVRYLPFFFFNDTATTEIYTLSLHDALPISSASGPLLSRGGPVCPPNELRFRPWRRAASCPRAVRGVQWVPAYSPVSLHPAHCAGDRKSTRLNSSHANISYAVFCLKKKRFEL